MNVKCEIFEHDELVEQVLAGVSEVVTSDIKVDVKEEGEGAKEEVPEGVEKTEIKVEIKEESLEEQIKVHANNDPAAALKVLQLEYMILERDSVKVKSEEDKPSTSNAVVTHSGEVPKQTSKQASTGPSRQDNDSSEDSEGDFSEDCDLEEEDFEQVAISGKSKKRSGPKIHKCEGCPYQTKNLWSLNRHRRTHTGEKPFSCGQCGYRTADKANLTRHEAAHSGTKPFSCTVCEFRTANRGDLKQHERTHSGIKPYACTVCEFRTAQKGDLKKHERVHSGIKPYACSECEFRTAYKSHLKRHMSRIHTLIPCDSCSNYQSNKYHPNDARVKLCSSCSGKNVPC